MEIPCLSGFTPWQTFHLQLSNSGCFNSIASVRRRRKCGDFASISIADKSVERENFPTKAQFLKHPLALVALVPRDASLFVAGATAKSVTAPIDRVKLLMQTHGIRAAQECVKRGIGFLDGLDFVVATGVRVANPSTVVDMTGNVPRILRQGKVVIELYKCSRDGISSTLFIYYRS